MSRRKYNDKIGITKYFGITYKKDFQNGSKRTRWLVWYNDSWINIVQLSNLLDAKAPAITSRFLTHVIGKTGDIKTISELFAVKRNYFSTIRVAKQIVPKCKKHVGRLTKIKKYKSDRIVDKDAHTDMMNAMDEGRIDDIDQLRSKAYGLVN